MGTSADVAELLACKQLVCGYPGRKVLEDVSFEVEAGSITALLGPNGSGKSTLLKTICRLTPALGGTISVGGSDVMTLSHKELAKRVSFVPQQEHPVFEFGVRQIVLMGRLPHSDGLFETEEDHIAAERAMEDADCTYLANRPVTELSGGEQQRVLIARALAQQAPLILLDEPTAHLDVGHQLSIKDLLGGLASRGYGILVAAHDLNFAGSLADHAILLDSGQVGMMGATREVLESEMLDQVYGVEFERADHDSGLRVFPLTRRA